MRKSLSILLAMMLVVTSAGLTMAGVSQTESTYNFSYDMPNPIIVGEDSEILVTFATDALGTDGYEGVRFTFNAMGGPGAVTFKATDSEYVEHTFTNSGFWGPEAGFILPANYTAATNWTLNFSAAGEYTITFTLIEALTGDVVAEITDSVTLRVLEAKSTYEFSYDAPEIVLVGDEVAVDVTFATEILGAYGYDNVRFAFSATGPRSVTFKATDLENAEHLFVNSGYWGPVVGFELPADYSATTPWTMTFSAAGEYTIGFSLIEAPAGALIPGMINTVTINVIEELPSTFKFKYTLPETVVKDESTSVAVTFETDVLGTHGYDGVLFAFNATGPDESTVTFKATDTMGVQHTFINWGNWGLALGFSLPAEYKATTNWTLTFSAAGTYNITFSLIDVSNNVIAGTSRTVTVNVSDSEVTTRGEVSFEALLQRVQTLADNGTLNKGRGNALTSTISAAIRSHEKGNHHTASNNLGAFINQANALIKSRTVTQQEGAELIELARAVREQLPAKSKK